MSFVNQYVEEEYCCLCLNSDSTEMDPIVTAENPEPESLRTDQHHAVEAAPDLDPRSITTDTYQKLITESHKV